MERPGFTSARSILIWGLSMKIHPAWSHHALISNWQQSSCFNCLSVWITGVSSSALTFGSSRFSGLGCNCANQNIHTYTIYTHKHIHIHKPHAHIQVYIYIHSTHTCTHIIHIHVHTRCHALSALRLSWKGTHVLFHSLF